MYSLIPAGGVIPNLQPRFNICPTTLIDVLLPEFDQRRLVQMRWSLAPSWWTKPLKELPATFNARAETVADKPVFRLPFQRRRCLIPASGYFEGKPTPDGKQPFYFTRRDGQPVTIAGLYDIWIDPKSK